MNLSGMFTTALSVIAAWQGVGGAPTAASRQPPPGDAMTTPLPLTKLDNRLTPDLLQALEKNYGDCRARMGENRRLFGGHTEISKQAICLKTAGRAAAFSHALKNPAAELPVGLHALKRIDYSESPMPLPELNMADYSDEQVLANNWLDYVESGSTQYAAIKASQVDLLRQFVPADQRGTVAAARHAATAPECVAAWKEKMQQWARTVISELTVMLNMRSVGLPQTIDVEDQLYDLTESLKEMEFGHSALKRRMFNDAVAALVAEHLAGRA